MADAGDFICNTYMHIQPPIYAIECVTYMVYMEDVIGIFVCSYHNALFDKWSQRRETKEVMN